MSVPEHLWRHPTRAAIDSLAKRFNLPNDPGMQDWEIEVADPSRIGEFIAAYESGVLTEDERFTLMATIIQSFEEARSEPTSNPLWGRALNILDRDIDLHISSVWHWADEDGAGDGWRVTQSIRHLLEKHRKRFSKEKKNNNG